MEKYFINHEASLQNAKSNDGNLCKRDSEPSITAKVFTVNSLHNKTYRK